MKKEFMIKRLRRMSAGELVFRSYRRLLAEYEKRYGVPGGNGYEITGKEGGIFGTAPDIKDVSGLLGLADRLCENRLDIFALKDTDVGVPINYHKDYKSGRTAPADKFGKSFDYRDNGIGDIKYIWEPNRQLFLVPLALAHSLTVEGKYIKKLEYYLSQWLRQNPFMKGVNWTSSLEAGIRLINWAICWQLAGGFMDPLLKAEWLKSVYRHCLFIDRNYSRFSSANNHLIGEAAGVFVACTAFPQFGQMARWRERAYGILVRESGRQIYEDGVNREQALSYQQFVLDFLIIAGLAGKANGMDFPEGYWFTLEKMLVYLLAIGDVSGHYPQIGDEDDGYVISLLQKEYGAYRSLLNTGAFLFGRKDFLQPDWENDIKTRFLLTIGNSIKAVEPLSSGKTPLAFEEGGYFLLGKEFGKEKEQKLLFDCGPLGYLSIAAHAHADALSFVFSAGGSRIFVDPGTFSYHTQPEWRTYFRGTSAHNTAVVDGRNQSEITGNFMWGRRAAAALLEYEELRHVKGKHDGYKSFRDEVVHQREIGFDEASNRWTVTDEFMCGGKHDISLFFHLDPGCTVEVSDNGAVIAFEKGRCLMEFDKRLKLTAHRGELEPKLGWYSSSYDVRTESDTLRLEGRIDGNARFTSTFKIDFNE